MSKAVTACVKDFGFSAWGRLNQCNRDGINLAHYAASIDCVEMLEFLKNLHFDFYARTSHGLTPMDIAAEKFHIRSLAEMKYLGIDIEHKDEDNLSAVVALFSSVNGEPDELLRFLEELIIFKIIDKSHPDYLNWAAHSGKIGVYKMFEKAGFVFDKDDEGNYPIHNVVIGHKSQLLKELCKTPESLRKMLSYKDLAGNDAFMMAILTKKKEICDEFLKFSFDEAYVQNVLTQVPENYEYNYFRGKLESYITDNFSHNSEIVSKLRAICSSESVSLHESHDAPEVPVDEVPLCGESDTDLAALF